VNPTPKRTGLVCPACRQPVAIIENRLPKMIRSSVLGASTAGPRTNPAHRSSEGCSKSIGDATVALTCGSRVGFGGDAIVSSATG
jgi:hypothetical protein